MFYINIFLLGVEAKTWLKFHVKEFSDPELLIQRLAIVLL
jgi:hypothetical protein